MEDAELKLDSADFDGIAAEVDVTRWHAANKIALVSSDEDQFDQLVGLSETLWRRRLNVAPLICDKLAVEWLSHTI